MQQTKRYDFELELTLSSPPRKRSPKKACIDCGAQSRNYYRCKKCHTRQLEAIDRFDPNEYTAHLSSTERRALD